LKLTCSDAPVTQQVRLRGVEDRGVVTQSAKSQIALVAQKTTDIPSGMTMIQVKRFGAAVSALWGSSANGTQAPLFLHKAFVNVYPNTVDRLQVVVFPATLGTRKMFVPDVLHVFHRGVVDLRVPSIRVGRATRYMLEHLFHVEHITAPRAGLHNPTARPNQGLSTIRFLWFGFIPQAHTLPCAVLAGIAQPRLAFLVPVKASHRPDLLANGTDLLGFRETWGRWTFLGEMRLDRSARNCLMAPLAFFSEIGGHSRPHPYYGSSGRSLRVHRFSRLQVSRTARRIASASDTRQYSARFSRILRSSLEMLISSGWSFGCCIFNSNIRPISQKNQPLSGVRRRIYDGFQGFSPRRGRVAYEFTVSGVRRINIQCPGRVIGLEKSRELLGSLKPKATVISSQARKREGSTAIPSGSTAKRLEARDTLRGDDMVCSLVKAREGRA